MPVTTDGAQTEPVIRIEGALGLAGAEELKKLLLERLQPERRLRVELDEHAELEVALLQLLLAAEQEACNCRAVFTGVASPAAMIAARQAGFANVPGGSEQA